MIDNLKLAQALYRTILRREPSDIEALQFVPDLEMQRYSEVIDQFLRSEEGRSHMARSLDLFVPPGHFYSPVVDTQLLRQVPPVHPYSNDPNLPFIRIDGPRMREFWRGCSGVLRECPFPVTRSAGFRYFFENHSYSYADASMLYAMLRTFQPRRVIEVGSGNSSACMLDTIERYLPADTEVTCIEPYPDLLLELMHPQDRDRIRLVDRPVQLVELELFDELRANDILFIDSTHVAKTGSDVCHEFFNILPFLNEGVLIHFHDVFYPFEYPDSWVYDEKRSWNELYLMRAFLMYNDAFEVVFFNDYFARFHRPDIEDVYPTFLKNTGGALWLRKVAPALKRR
jgi:predicted O-methyltransferase YrrM